MSEKDTSASAAGGEPNELHNLKQEMTRKLSNVDAGFNAIQQQLAELTKKMAPVVQPKVEAPDLNTLAVTDPVEYARVIKDQTLAEVRAEQARVSQAQQYNQTVISKLLTEFPEAGQPGHQLYDKVQQILVGMSDEERNNSANWKSVVLEAALDLGIKPRSKRKADEEEPESFSFGGSSGGSRPETKTSGKNKLDPRTIEFAALVGLDVKDQKVLADLEKTSSRKDWRKYERR